MDESSARRTRWVWVATGVVAAALVALGVVMVGFRLGGGETSASPTIISTTEAQARDAAAALHALSSKPEMLVASGAQSTVAGRASEAVPPGSKVEPDVKSWAPDGLGGGTMYVKITPPGQAAIGYFAVMVREKGQWKVMATIPVTSEK